MGGRADSGAVRHGAERAEVSAAFDVDRNAGAMAWLEEQSIEHEGEVQLRRVVAADGRSRAYVNGQAVPVQSLRSLGEHLVDVHGQLEFQSLSRRGYQRELLDSSGALDADAAAVRDAFLAWRALDQQRSEFERRGRDRDDRLELVGHYLAELEVLDPRPARPRNSPRNDAGSPASASWPRAAGRWTSCSPATTAERPRRWRGAARS